MSLTIIVSKNKIHKLAHVRNKIRKRIRAAVRLVVQSGILPSGRNSFSQAPVTGPAHHLLPGHRYMMQTSLELYRMPMDKLVPLIKDAFRAVYVRLPAIIHRLGTTFMNPAYRYIAFQVVGQTQLVDQAFEAECDTEQLRLDGIPEVKHGLE